MTDTPIFALDLALENLGYIRQTAEMLYAKLNRTQDQFFPKPAADALYPELRNVAYIDERANAARRHLDAVHHYLRNNNPSQQLTARERAEAAHAAALVAIRQLWHIADFYVCHDPDTPEKARLHNAQIDINTALRVILAALPAPAIPTEK